MSRIIKERRQRVELLLRELRYEIIEHEESEDSCSASFQKDSEFIVTYFIDRQSKFVEFSFIFSFSVDFQDYVRNRLEEMLQCCYEFGTYIGLASHEGEIIFSIFSKIYFSGLNYHTLKHTLKDHRDAALGLTQLLDISNKKKKKD